MPTIFRAEGYRFFFFSNEGREPVHVHVEKADAWAKIWIDPKIRLHDARGFHASELKQIQELVVEHEHEIRKAWHEYFRR
jgi:CRISPR/Cas system-associated endonuclease Cas1